MTHRDYDPMDTYRVRDEPHVAALVRGITVAGHVLAVGAAERIARQRQEVLGSQHRVTGTASFIF